MKSLDKNYSTTILFTISFLLGIVRNYLAQDYQYYIIFVLILLTIALFVFNKKWHNYLHVIPILICAFSYFIGGAVYEILNLLIRLRFDIILAPIVMLIVAVYLASSLYTMKYWSYWITLLILSSITIFLIYQGFGEPFSIMQHISNILIFIVLVYFIFNLGVVIYKTSVLKTKST